MTVNATGCGFDPIRRNEIFISIFPFHPAFGRIVEALRVEFRHSTLNAFRTRQKREWRKKCLKIRLPLPFMLCDNAQTCVLGGYIETSSRSNDMQDMK